MNTHLSGGFTNHQTNMRGDSSRHAALLAALLGAVAGDVSLESYVPPHRKPSEDPEAAAKLQEERQRRKREAWLKRQPKEKP